MSQKKRLSEKRKREEALKKELQSRKRTQISIIVIGVLVVLIIAGAIIFDVVRKTETEIDYSIGLNADGRIKGVDTSKCVELADLNQLNMNTEDYYPSAEEENDYIERLLASYPALDEKEGDSIADGDTIAITYKCYMDGTELPDEGSGDLTERMMIGSSGYPEEFEAQIKEHKTGETFKFEMPFPIDYYNQDVAGKDAEFEVTVVGKYYTPEFNDEFIENNFAGLVDDAEDFLQRYRKDYAETAFDEYVKDYVFSGSNVDVPASYLKSMKKYMKAKDIKQMTSTNETFMNLYGYKKYENVYEMRQIEKSEYDSAITESALEEAKKNLIYQAAFDNYGLTITDEDIEATKESYSLSDEGNEDAVERFGNAYINQMTIQEKVDAYLTDSYNLP